MFQTKLIEIPNNKFDWIDVPIYNKKDLLKTSSKKKSCKRVRFNFE
uniref:Uncharacterized protein n=1 Tax=viral metagenome TaxID=1070528 RepID=A0A6C0AEU4_9ZZZZ